MSGLGLKNLSKRYGHVEVINDLSLDIPSGEFVVFLGPSGCGKWTLLRMIAGLETVTAGEIHLDGRRIDGLAPGDRGGLTLFALNRDLVGEMALDVSARGFSGLSVVEAITLCDPDLEAANTKQTPDRVVPQALVGVAIDDERITATLPPAS